MTPSPERLTYRVARHGTVVGMNGDGHGEIVAGGVTISIPGALPGESVAYEVLRQRRRRASGRLIATPSASPWRTDGVCGHYPLCGGCAWQGVSATHQAQLKQDRLHGLLSRANPEWVTTLQPLIAAPATQHHRNKMEYAFGTHQGQVVVGLKQRGAFDSVVNTPQCNVQLPWWPWLHEGVTQWANATGLPAYDPVTHEGVLRYVMVRQSAHTGQVVVVVVSRHDIAPTMSGLWHALCGHPHIQGVGMAVQDTDSDTAFSEHVVTIGGTLMLSEQLNGVSYDVAPYSFFQPNALQAPTLYRVIASMADTQPSDGVLDLYCGGGGIGLSLAASVAWVVGIESNRFAIAAAHRNMADNGVSNMQVIEGTVRRVLKTIACTPDVVVADPPRSGMEPKSIGRSLALKPRVMVMVSCQPTTLVRDLLQCETLGYTPRVIQGVDMFPNTPHVEVVVKLTPSGGG